MLIPNTTKASTSSIYSRLGKKNNVNLQDLYAKSTSYYGVKTTLNKGSLFSPKDITGCGLFLSADDKSCLLNNGNVYQWTDLSGNGRHAVQTTVANQPLYKSSDTYLNNKPCIYFDGVTSTGLTTTSSTGTVSLATLTNFTVCMVLYVRSNTNSKTVIIHSFKRNLPAAAHWKTTVLRMEVGFRGFVSLTCQQALDKLGMPFKSISHLCKYISEI